MVDHTGGGAVTASRYEANAESKRGLNEVPAARMSYVSRESVTLVGMVGIIPSAMAETVPLSYFSARRGEAWTCE